MISPALCPTLTLLLIIFTIFTVSLTETLQLADAEWKEGDLEWKAAANPTVFELQVGESQMLSWPISNLSNKPIEVEMYTVGEGGELFILPEYSTIPPASRIEVEIFVSVPEDHPDNVEYHPQLKVLKRAPQLAEGESGIRINMQYTLLPIIKIGDSPIFTQPEKVAVVEIPKEKPKEERAQETVKPEDKEIELTIEEKMARIQAANQANAPEEVIVDDVFEEAFEEEAVPDYDPEPIVIIQQEDKVECGFLEWLLSLFGIKSDCI